MRHCRVFTRNVSAAEIQRRDLTTSKEATFMATVVGLFDTRDRAQAAIEQLRSSGMIEPDKISVVMRSREETQEIVNDTGVGGGAVTGAIGGGVLGGLAGLLVGIGALAIPGIGPIVAGGWLASTLVGAGIGAATGGLVG